MRLIFRDHFMSDLIGFVYSKMEASHAAADFLHRIRQNCAGILASGRDALVPIILDGENAWEYYHHNGRPFLRELYRRISDDRGDVRRHRQRSVPPDGARTAGPHLSRLVDQRQFRYLDRRRGRQPGLDAIAARTRHLRRHHRRARGAAGVWRTRNC